MKTIAELTDLKNKKVLMRADFDVSLLRSSGASEGQAVIAETFRIRRQKETVDYLLAAGARVVMVAHISAVKSFTGIVGEIGTVLGRDVELLYDLSEIADGWADSNLALLDNVRRWPGEEANDPEFAKQLAHGADLYVNNAFAVCHREHASVSAIAEELPAYAGFLLAQETTTLTRILDAPTQGKVVIMGGAKAETKVPAIKNLLDKAEHILVGGVIANDIVKARGGDVGSSVVDEHPETLLAGVDLNSPQILVPEDFVVSDGGFFDIGPQATRRFLDAVGQARLIIWNGPLGKFEDMRFAAATDALAQAIVASEAFSVIGGGDTIAAVDRLGLLGRFGFVSTGGGAMLAFLAGQELPGLVALQK